MEVSRTPSRLKFLLWSALSSTTTVVWLLMLCIVSSNTFAVRSLTHNITEDKIYNLQDGETAVFNCTMNGETVVYDKFSNIGPTAQRSLSIQNSSITCNSKEMELLEAPALKFGTPDNGIVYVQVTENFSCHNSGSHALIACAVPSRVNVVYLGESTVTEAIGQNLRKHVTKVPLDSLVHIDCPDNSAKLGWYKYKEDGSKNICWYVSLQSPGVVVSCTQAVGIKLGVKYAGENDIIRFNGKEYVKLISSISCTPDNVELIVACQVPSDEETEDVRPLNYNITEDKLYILQDGDTAVSRCILNDRTWVYDEFSNVGLTTQRPMWSKNINITCNFKQMKLLDAPMNMFSADDYGNVYVKVTDSFSCHDYGHYAFVACAVPLHVSVVHLGESTVTEAIGQNLQKHVTKVPLDSLVQIDCPNHDAKVAWYKFNENGLKFESFVVPATSPGVFVSCTEGLGIKQGVRYAGEDDIIHFNGSKYVKILAATSCTSADNVELIVACQMPN